MNDQREYIIIGGGGHAVVLLDCLKLNGLKVIGYTDMQKTDLPDIKYLGDDRVLKQYSPKDYILVNGIGSVRIPEARREVFKKFKEEGYGFATVIHPQAIISTMGVNLGEGAQILVGAIINPRVMIGENVIINTKASIDHDCIIGAHTHIAPGVTLSGGVITGEACHIGTGAQVIQSKKLGKEVIIGAGTTVIQDFDDYKSNVGTRLI